MSEKSQFYKAQLLRLFPIGKLFDIVPDGTLDKLLEGISVELARIDDRAANLLVESDPRRTSELLEDWERVCGLPGPCGSLAVTIQERRDQIVTLLNLRGPQNKAFIAEIGQGLGYDIEASDIEEHPPFVAGSRCGGRLTNGDEWPHAFTVTVSEFTVRHFKAGTHRAGDRLLEFGDDLLECLINAQKPAHTIAIFRYI